MEVNSRDNYVIIKFVRPKSWPRCQICITPAPDAARQRGYESLLSDVPPLPLCLRRESVSEMCFLYLFRQQIFPSKFKLNRNITRWTTDVWTIGKRCCFATLEDLLLIIIEAERQTDWLREGRRMSNFSLDAAGFSLWMTFISLVTRTAAMSHTKLFWNIHQMPKKAFGYYHNHVNTTTYYARLFKSLKFHHLQQRTLQPSIVTMVRPFGTRRCSKFVEKAKKKKDANPIIIRVFRNQEVVCLLLSASHSLKVSEELARAVGLAKTGGGSDQVLQTFLLSFLISLPLSLFLLLLYTEYLTLRPTTITPRFLRFSAWLQSPCRPRFIMSTSLPHERTDLTQNYYLREKKYTRWGLDGAWLGLCVHMHEDLPDARAQRGNLLHPAAVG